MSIASDMDEPVALATAEVRSTSLHTAAVDPWVKVATVAPLGGRLLKFRDPSVQLLSATRLMLCILAEPLETNILSVAMVITRPANGVKSNFI